MMRQIQAAASGVAPTIGGAAPTSAPNRVAVAAPQALSLPGAFRLFFGNLNAWILLGAVLATATWRLVLGDFTIWDAAIATLLVAWEPMQEWLIHVYILHWKPRTVLGVHVDPELCRKHRAHHEDPWHLPDVFIPRRTLIALLPALLLLWWAITPTLQLMATGLLTTFSIGLVYEWTHFLVHTHYKPRSKLYKQIFRYHRLHHFKNEHYWYGVTMHAADRLLKTLPQTRDVPTSPTARDIGGERAGGV